MEIEIKGNLRVKINPKDNTASIIEYTKPTGNVFIPHFANYENRKYKIISIEHDTFIGSRIGSLTFSKDSEVETFCYRLFNGAYINKLVIPASLKTLEDGWNCSIFDLKEVEISPNNSHFILLDKSILLGKSDDSIDKFDILHISIYGIEEAVIPAQVSIIKSYSFLFRRNLKSLKFSPNSELKIIEGKAFDSSSIECLSLPASVEQIDEECFYNTPNLHEIELSPENKKFKMIDNKYIVKESEVGSCVFDVIIFARRDIESINIPSHIKVIYNCAFQNCSRLKTVTFESNSSLELAKKHAFQAIEGPEKFVLPPSLKEAGLSSFSELENTKTIEFLAKSVIVGSFCFQSCKNLTSVTFPNADEVIFNWHSTLGMPDDLKFYVRRSAKLSGDGLDDAEERICYIESKEGGSEELAAKLMKAEDEISKLKEEVTKLKDDNKKLRQKVKKLEAKSDTNDPTLKGAVVKLDLFEPAEIDALKVVRTIGRGGQSEVFEVTREQRLALKVLFLEGANKSDNSSFKQLQRFLQEYEILSSLHHFNIVKTFGFCYGDVNHAPSILLELCEQNLNDRVSIMNKIDKICCIIEISQAMESVHAAHMIHRDLKPENVLFDSEGHVKISDFGVACIVDVEGQTQSKTSGVGTLKFMAPELLNESTKYDNKVDVYSFGVVLFFILSSGKMPKISIIEQGNGKKAQIPSSINKVSRDLINSCWSTLPSDRPSFTDILNTIKKNKFKLIDGVEKNISAIKNFVKI